MQNIISGTNERDLVVWLLFGIPPCESATVRILPGISVGWKDKAVIGLSSVSSSVGDFVDPAVWDVFGTDGDGFISSTAGFVVGNSVDGISAVGPAVGYFVGISVGGSVDEFDGNVIEDEVGNLVGNVVASISVPA